jgi:opacity protein-like surface antigen
MAITAQWLRQASPFLVAVAASLSAPAFAADLAPGSSASLPAFTWTGLYIGANAGAWFAPTNPSYEAIGFRSTGFDLVPNGGGPKAGFTGGFQAGYNYQIGPLVPGFESTMASKIPIKMPSGESKWPPFLSVRAQKILNGFVST